MQERTAELEESRQRFYDLAELLPETVFETDVYGNLTYANKHALETFGYTAEDIEQGLHVRDIVIEKDYGSLVEKASGVLEGKGPDRGETIVRRKNGTEFHVLVQANAIVHEGKIVGLRGVATDLTESRKAEAERMRLEKQLRQAHKMEAIGTLAGGIAHDFNNMLAIIMGNAELALDELHDDGSRQNIDQILKASKRSRDLVKKILTFSKKNVGQGKVVNIVPLLKETHDLLRASIPSTIHMNLNIRARADTAVVAQPSEIQQVVVNLANNAAHAMQQDGGTLTIGLSSITLGSDSLPEDNMKPGRYVKLTVKDTGTGIAPEVQRRMFEPFFTTKEQSRGTGMGLSVVYGIVKAYDGIVEVESEIGKGTKFTILLPQADVSSQMEEEEGGTSYSKAQSVLFIDDEPAIVEVAKTMLERMGCRVTAFTDPLKALKAFAEDPRTFDLIITDQTMPGITGVAFAKEVLAVRKDMPIILCTGYSETVSPEKAGKAGIREFVMKPITKNDMAQAIYRVLGQGEEVR